MAGSEELECADFNHGEHRGTEIKNEARGRRKFHDSVSPCSPAQRVVEILQFMKHLNYIALLRGINVGGHRKIRMADLKAMFERLGFENVQTYLQSGNVVFSDTVSHEERSERIEAAILEEFGHDVSVMVFSQVVFSEIADSNPLLSKNEVDPAFLHVTFLCEAANGGIAQDTIPLKGNEAAELKFGHYFLYCPNGYGRTKITNAYFEKALKVSATTRNWKTVQALKDMLAG